VPDVIGRSIIFVAGLEGVAEVKEVRRS